MRTTCGTILAAALAALSAHGAFDVRDFGAKGDGTTMDTSSIQSAIDKCGESGGGRVVLANGTFLSGSIRLRTGVELHIDGTARLLASSDVADGNATAPRCGSFEHIEGFTCNNTRFDAP